MTALLRLLTLVLIIVSLSSCESRKHDDLIVQYEKELSQDVSGYEFVNFEWFMAYTTKDSLNSSIADIRKAVDRNRNEANSLLEQNKSESEDYIRDRNLKKAEVKLKLTKVLDSIALSEEAKLNNLTDAQNDTIYKKAVHTYNVNGELFKVLVKFDGNGNYQEQEANAKAAVFDSVLGRTEKKGVRL